MYAVAAFLFLEDSFIDLLSVEVTLLLGQEALV